MTERFNAQERKAWKNYPRTERQNKLVVSEDDVKQLRNKYGGQFRFFYSNLCASLSQKNNLLQLTDSLIMQYHGLSNTGLEIRSIDMGGTSAKTVDRAKKRIAQQAERENLELIRTSDVIVTADNYDKNYPAQRFKMRTSGIAYKPAHFTNFAIELPCDPSSTDLLSFAEDVGGNIIPCLPPNGLFQSSSRISAAVDFILKDVNKILTTDFPIFHKDSLATHMHINTVPIQVRVTPGLAVLKEASAMASRSGMQNFRPHAVSIYIHFTLVNKLFFITRSWITILVLHLD